MKSIYPVKLENTSEQIIKLPRDYSISNLQLINRIATLFVYCDYDNEFVDVQFNICASGNIINSNGMYRGTYCLGDTGFHVFEIRTPTMFIEGNPAPRNSVYEKYVNRTKTDVIDGGFEYQPDGSVHWEEAGSIKNLHRDWLEELLGYHTEKMNHYFQHRDINTLKSAYYIHERYSKILSSMLMDIKK